MKKTGNLCELCKEEASVYCSADSAFLCWDCDHKVHRANFLVSRHVRRILCTECKSFCRSDSVWGFESQSSHHLCKACSSEKPEDPLFCSTLSLSSAASCSSSDCLSTSESSSNGSKPKGVCLKSRSSTGSHSGVSDTDGLEGVLNIWCKKLGLKRHSVASTAASALRFCLERLKGIPFRLSLAAAFWFGLRATRDTSVASWRNLRRLEELSGVPAKVIVAVEPRLARAMRLRKRITPDLEEGWAECNV
ncbi:B-box domain protein 32, EMF1-Interacting Protein 6 [Hibiscus trionum]|uniref:B-box domain protein 32, EMF1-Interacting Protein 6 n=1 Tax=Hibiscus trionum TaxID=183268 RepID=A0A9W7HJ64_HIBTR|nr:B-box domain protein 32, EMF1-Interacting Protein 6 [Hibiscus trionum]